MTQAFPIAQSSLDAALAVIGTTGAGKTYVAKGAVEMLLQLNRRVCIIDPTGVWHGLQTSADGLKPAFPVVIFGGEHADIQIDVGSGEALARIIASGQVRAAIIDTSEMTGGEMTRFLTPFFEELYAKNREALHLILDEADAFAPQNAMPGAERLKGVVDKIARRGRVKGFRLMSITQRPAVLDKSVLSMIGTLVSMQLTSPQDRKALEGWIKGNADEGAAKTVLVSLPKLSRGEGWVWSPRAGVLERVTFPPIRTLDTSRTPEPGDPIVEARAAAKVDLSAIRAAIGASFTVATAENASPATRAALAGVAEAGKAALEQLATAERRGYERGLADGRHAGAAEALEAAGGILSRMHGSIDAYVSEFERLVGATFNPDTPIEVVRRNKRNVTSTSKTEASAPTASSSGDLNGAARKMLAVLDTNPPVRRTWQQVATLAGLKARGGHFNAGKKALLDGGFVMVTSEGLIEHGNPSPAAKPPARDPASMVETWAAVLTGAAPKILRFLFSAGGAHSPVDIAQHLGMQPRGGHWNAAWKELRDNGIVTVDRTAAKLTELFHP